MELVSQIGELRQEISLLRAAYGGQCPTPGAMGSLLRTARQTTAGAASPRAAWLARLRAASPQAVPHRERSRSPHRPGEVADEVAALHAGLELQMRDMRHQAYESLFAQLFEQVDALRKEVTALRDAFNWEVAP
jgi:hypothetical protein